MRKHETRYWLCQIFGWGAWTLLNLFIAYRFAPDIYLKPDEKRNLFFIALGADLLWSILAAHLLRLVLRRLNWLRFPANRIILMFILGVVGAGMIAFFGAKYTAEVTDLSFEKYERGERLERAIKMEQDMDLAGTFYYQYEDANRLNQDFYMAAQKIKKSTGWFRDKNGSWHFEDQRRGRDFWNIIFTLILMSLWMLIYIVWHYVERNRKDDLDKLRLEGLVKSLELKTIKSHINPHFIFNALNSIRALVDENPARARRAITELSNILRSSLKAESLETAPLEQELSIVKDYLALEQMRFEERLRVEFDVAEETLSQPLPPMMLQTLVENAIKHGISKTIEGGLIRICSFFKDGNHELTVQNTGHIGSVDAEGNKGFGIKSTEDRLNMLYQGQARFEIRNLEGNIVESKIILPAQPAVALTN